MLPVFFSWIQIEVSGSEKGAVQKPKKIKVSQETPSRISLEKWQWEERVPQILRSRTQWPWWDFSKLLKRKKIEQSGLSMFYRTERKPEGAPACDLSQTGFPASEPSIEKQESNQAFSNCYWEGKVAQKMLDSTSGRRKGATQRCWGFPKFSR